MGHAMSSSGLKQPLQAAWKQLPAAPHPMAHTPVLIISMQKALGCTFGTR